MVHTINHKSIISDYLFIYKIICSNRINKINKIILHSVFYIVLNFF